MAPSSFPAPAGPPHATAVSCVRPVQTCGDHVPQPPGPPVHCHSFDLPAVPAEVARVRASVAFLMRGWGVDPAAWDDVLLVVSELATNALQHSSHDRIVGRFVHVHGLLRFEVEEQDIGPALPEARQADDDDENGRGLFLVDALSTDWGVTPLPDGDGHIVWAELDAGANLPPAHGDRGHRGPDRNG